MSSKIEFISHEAFPDDEYTKELVYICLEGKFRVAYVRKKLKTGAMFWAPVSVGISKHGAKEYFPAFMQDSNFLEKDIKDFLENRSWEVRANSYQAPHAAYQAPAPTSMSEVAEQEQLPF